MAVFSLSPPDGERFLRNKISRVAPMNLTLRHVVPALAGAIAIRNNCFATSLCCRLKAGLRTGRFVGRKKRGPEPLSRFLDHGFHGFHGSSSDFIRVIRVIRG